jgi:hypothetical protein
MSARSQLGDLGRYILLAKWRKSSLMSAWLQSFEAIQAGWFKAISLVFPRDLWLSLKRNGGESIARSIVIRFFL